MLCVRYGFRIQLIGLGSATGNLSTALFVGFYCTLIPLSLLVTRQIHRLVWPAVFVSAAGIAALLLFDRAYVYIASVLLASGSALLTASFFHVYVYVLTKREQVALTVIFLIAKPLFSLTAVFISSDKMWYIAFTALVLVGIALCSRSLRRGVLAAPVVPKTPVKAPFWTLAGICGLFALIVFERMNGVFTLFVQGRTSPLPYYFYFAGGLAMALASWWMFVHKKISLARAFDIFLFSAILHFVLSIAAENGLILFDGIDMIFFGLSDIVYLFLFVTAASISASYSKKVFIGFIFVFGFSLITGFGLSELLYVRFQSIYAMVYALESLALIALSLLLSPLLHRISPASRKKAPAKAEQQTVANPRLTSRETEIVDLYLKGYSNKQIADMLHIAPATVKVHSRNIYDKLNVRSRIELLFMFQGKPGG